MLVARYSISCIRARLQGDDTNSRVVSATFALPVRETSSSLGLCIICGQRDHVIALYSIVSLGMCGELVGTVQSVAQGNSKNQHKLHCCLMP